jgi:hypothetical protein
LLSATNTRVTPLASRTKVGPPRGSAEPAEAVGWVARIVPPGERAQFRSAHTPAPIARPGTAAASSPWARALVTRGCVSTLDGGAIRARTHPRPLHATLPHPRAARAYRPCAIFIITSGVRKMMRSSVARNVENRSRLAVYARS